MKTKNNIFFTLLIMGLFIIGCDKSTDPVVDSSVLFEDAAESISAAMGDESGGVTESFADVMIAGGAGTLGSASPAMEGADLVTAGVPVYDSLTGWWSVSVNRSLDNMLVQRSITREYQYLFQLNGNFQKRYIVNGDTATTLKFKIVSGTGYFNNARVSHHLTHLSGAWTSSDINKDTVTISLDNIFVRSGVDSIKTRNLLRTHNSTLTITGVNVKAPRYRPLDHTTWRNNFYRAISGTISGNYSATIAFQRGDAYKERSINRDFTITVGDGEGNLFFNGGERFRINLSNGQRK